MAGDDGLRKPKRRPTPSNWASLKPFGIGEEHPNNFYEVFRAGWENKDEAKYAWRILNEGICDGCALGTKGMHDWTLDGIHLCNVRLRLLRLNTMREFDGRICEDVSKLAEMRGRELRQLGRIPYPMIRRTGERGFSRISWDDALDLAAERIREAGPERIGFYLTSRGMPNESYYAAQKAARAMGTNSVDNAARLCHSPSTFGLKEAVGVGASTCSFADWIGTDLLLFVGSNVATNQPVATKYIYQARKAGTRVISVNPFREPGMDRYWIPSNAESAIFGTKIAHQWFGLNIGGDVAFFSGVLRHLIENGWIDRNFVDNHTEGWKELCDELLASDWEVLEAVAGATRESMLDLARQLSEAKRGVIVWSMGVTQHAHGEHGVRAILNLGLSQGWVGKPGCGLMPIRGHSGVQGGAEMGCYSTNFPGGREINEENAKHFADLWGFGVPSAPGLRTPEMLDAARRGELDVFFASGGNFLDTMPDQGRTRTALEKLPLRIHMDITLSSQMFAEPGEAVLVLPAMTRYEIPGGITETSTERRVILSPEIPGPRVDEARSEWEVLLELAARVKPEIADKLRVGGTPELRAEIAKANPDYARIVDLQEGGDSFQYGGRLHPEGTDFPTESGKAHFALVRPPTAFEAHDDGSLALSTRRGKQFNSIVQEDHDAVSTMDREMILMSAKDAEARGLATGQPVVARSKDGELRCRVHVAADLPRQRTGPLARGQRSDRRRDPLRPRLESPTTTPASRSSLSEVRLGLGEVLGRVDVEGLVCRRFDDLGFQGLEGRGQ